MALKRCAHCRYLFEGTKDVCPACKRPVGLGPTDERLEDRRTVKRPPIKPKI
jgi:hypothetical protein